MQSTHNPTPRTLLDRFFLEHPEAVGESYFEHQRAALGFGLRMIAAGAACLVHGLIPCAFTKTGSDTVTVLHSNLRARAGAADKKGDQA